VPLGWNACAPDRDHGERRRGTSMKRLAVAVLSLCVCVGLIGCGTVVPDVKGKTVSQAEKMLVGAGFKVGIVGYDQKATGRAGLIISQTPKGGGRSKDGVSVSLIIAGPPPVPTPALVGMDRAKAEVTLKGIGLTLGAVTESYDASLPAGAVAKQVPVPGTDVDKGSAVAIVLSRGPKPVPVPSAVGRTQAEATSLLASADFQVTVTSISNAAAKGTVVSQTPSSGEAQPGTAVVINVSTGVDLVLVPSWRDFPSSYNGDDWARTLDSIQASVEAGFKRAGLVAHIEFVNANAGDSDYQSPKSGSRVPRGTRVQIRIAVSD
jgi:beta-lactam-binding protein with PASTA domain